MPDPDLSPTATIQVDITSPWVQAQAGDLDGVKYKLIVDRLFNQMVTIKVRGWGDYWQILGPDGRLHYFEQLTPDQAKKIWQEFWGLDQI